MTTKGTQGTQEGSRRRRFFLVRGERFDWPGEFTGRELQFIKLETGLRSGELDEALDAGDVEAMLALVVVAMRRAGREDAQLDDLLDLNIGDDGPEGIDFLIEDEDGEGRPTEAADGAALETTDPTPKVPKGTAARTGRRRSSGSTGSGRGN